MNVFLAAPGYGNQTAAAGRAIWRASRNMDSVMVSHLSSSLLAANFNGLWCAALNEEYKGRGVDYFAMIHADIGADDFWLDTLIEELEESNLDVLGVAVPIKDYRGVTSCAVDGDSLWRPKCRITMKELASLPPTFTSDDVGGPLLLNTGLWVCRFDLEWALKVKFTINDRIVYNKPEDRYEAESEPEDWYFSRLCHELGLRIGATRKVSVMHRGEIDFSNQTVWGNDFDADYGATGSVVSELFPVEVEGWLKADEGRILAELCDGKRVLEIGSYCGRSTICIARRAASVDCVDWWDGRGTAVPQNTLGKFQNNLQRYGVLNKCTIRYPYENLDGKYDVAFIDGAHDYESVKSDIRKAVRTLTDDGIIVFHDYLSEDDPGVTKAVDELISRGGHLIKREHTLAVVRPPTLASAKKEIYCYG